MIDWGTVANIATASGTLVLAAATFSSVRSANRTARSAERALLVGIRPVLFPSRPSDPNQMIRWGDDHWATIPGGQGVLECVDGVVYMAMSLRNVGAGLAVLRGWRVEPSRRPQSLLSGGVNTQRGELKRPDPNAFRLQSRDLYVPPGDISFWQAAFRDPEDADRAGVEQAVENHEPVTVYLLYGDHEGGQRTISHFQIVFVAAEDEWVCSVVRHWNLDREDPR